MMADERVLDGYRDKASPAQARGLEALGGEPVVAARGATLRTSSGAELVDMVSGGFGYGHPDVVRRVREQICRMPLSSRVLFSRPLAAIIDKLAELTPGDLQVSFLGASGSEAVEGALKLVKGFHRGRTKLVAATNSYHGATIGALSICGQPPLRRPCRPPLATSFVPFGDITALQREIDEQTAALVLEPVQTRAGIQVPDVGYLRAARARCTEVGALLVIDEITTGLGHTGWLFAVDRAGVAPDVMTLAGALGGGVLPVGAYVATRQVNDRVYDKKDPLLHANTTGGNPAACTAALAALEVATQQGLPARARALGAKLLARLEQWRSDHAEAIVETSGIGLLASVRVAGVALAQAVQREARARGALVAVDGLSGACAGQPWLTLRPPLLISEAELSRGLDAVDEALRVAGEDRSTSAPEPGVHDGEAAGAPGIVG